MNEQIWSRFHRDQARRERFRLTKKGVITPAFAMQPQLLVRSDANGGWSPEIKTCS